MEEKCEKCGKTKGQHLLELGARFCYDDKKRQDKWTAPAPQAALFDAEVRGTGYEQ